jgi:outer membrane biosynthesis protein TonB
MKMDSGQTIRDRRKGEHGASQNLLLGVLAALIALLGYLYFFTGVIKEREIQQKPLPAAVQKVKQPIPPRPASAENRSAPQPEKKPETANAPAPAAKPQATPIPVAIPKPLPVAAQKTPATAAKPAVEQPKATPQATAQAAAKPENKPVEHPLKPQVKTAAPEKIAKKTTEIKPTKIKSASEGRYRIVTSGIFSSAKADSVLSSMKKGGLEKIERKQLTEEKSMKRLFVSELDDSQAAHAELEKVKKLSPGAFLVTESGKYALYAGSYDLESRADIEVKRLSGQGLNVTIRKAKLTLPVTRITAVATDKARADEFVKRLTKLGVPSEVKQVDK